MAPSLGVRHSSRLSPITMPPRSYLFVPADRPDRLTKALASGADAVIVDLEDAVAPEAKATARHALAQWMTAASPTGQTTVPLLVRINAPGTAWFADDVLLCGSSTTLHGVMVPKAERVVDLATVHRAAPHLKLVPLIETAAGMDNLRALTNAAGVQRLAFGSIDFQLDLGMGVDSDNISNGNNDEAMALLPWRAQIVMATRLASLWPAIDGVTTALDDDARVLRDVQMARRLGFGAKLCIHPRQVATVNASFAPSDAEVAWARRVIDAVQKSRGAAVAVNGRMVDKPVEMRARALLGLAGDAAA
jgi:citrate lyase subunit beta / citryl-CoA lyase